MGYMEELTVHSYEMIRTVGIYMRQTDEGELQELLKQQLPHLLQCYNKVVEFVEGEMLQELLVQSLCTRLTVVEEELPAGDAIACLYMQDMRQMASFYAEAAVHVMNPELREFLEQSFLLLNRQVYEVWHYIMKRGAAAPVQEWYREAQ